MPLPETISSSRSLLMSFLLNVQDLQNWSEEGICAFWRRCGITNTIFGQLLLQTSMLAKPLKTVVMVRITVTPSYCKSVWQWYKSPVLIVMTMMHLHGFHREIFYQSLHWQHPYTVYILHSKFLWLKHYAQVGKYKNFPLKSMHRHDLNNADLFCIWLTGVLGYIGQKNRLFGPSGCSGWINCV